MTRSRFQRYIAETRRWFDQRDTREKVLITLLTWAFMYGFFTLFFFYSQDSLIAELVAQNRDLTYQAEGWRKQIDALNKIGTTPLYNDWVKHKKLLSELQGQYELLLKQSPTKQWQDVIKTILQEEKKYCARTNQKFSRSSICTQ